MRYTVYENMGGMMCSVLKTDSLEEARARYAKCWGSQRGNGGIFDNHTRNWIA